MASGLCKSRVINRLFREAQQSMSIETLSVASSVNARIQSIPADVMQNPERTAQRQVAMSWLRIGGLRLLCSRGPHGVQ
eukprot:5514388-Amphidinium_carterae.2